MTTDPTRAMRFAYADPPYPGQSLKHYGGHSDYAGEVDHAALLADLAGFDGWVLHTSSTALAGVLAACPAGVRVGAWVKPFAAFKRNVSPAYAWEPVIFSPVRKPITPSPTGITMRDWFSAPITMQRGLTGAKPERLCWWAFEVAGCRPGDALDDLFPGSGAVGRAWDSWRGLLTQEADALSQEGGGNGR